MGIWDMIYLNCLFRPPWTSVTSPIILSSLVIESMGYLVPNDHANCTKVEVSGPASLEERGLQDSSRESWKGNPQNHGIQSKPLTDSVMIRRIPSVDNSWVHQPNVSVRFFSQGDNILLGRPSFHRHNFFKENRAFNICIPRIFLKDMKVPELRYQKYLSTWSLSRSQSG